MSAPNLPSEGGSYTRDDKGGLQRQAPVPPKTTRKEDGK